MIDSDGRTIWIVDSHRYNGKRFVVRADENVDRVFGTGIGDLRGNGLTRTQNNGRTSFVFFAIVKRDPLCPSHPRKPTTN